MGRKRCRIYSVSGRYGVDYTINKKRYQFIVGSRSQAVQKSKIIEADLFRGYITNHKKNNVSFKAACEAYIRARLTHNNKYSKTESSRIRKLFIPYFKDTFLSDFGDQKEAELLLQNYCSWRLKMKNNRGEPLRNHTLYFDLKRLRAMFETFKEWKELEENPIKKFQMPKFIVREFGTLSLFEIKRLLECAKSHSGGFIYPLVLLGLNGLRRAEATNLEWSDIDLKKKTLHIRNKETFRTKSGKNRIIPMHETLYDCLISMPKDSQYIIGYQGRKIKEFRKTWKRIKNLSGIKEEFRFHDLRHTICSHLVSNGDIKSAQLLLGHSTIKLTLDIYSHLLPNDVQVALNRVSFGKISQDFSKIEKTEVLSA